MKYKILEDGVPMQTKKVIKHIEVPNLIPTSKPKEVTKFYARIFTDGKVYKVDSKEEKISEYKIKNKTYNDVDTLKINDIYLKDYTYVIVYEVAKEVKKYNMGFYKSDVTKDINIYLKTKNDKEALKRVKETIKEVKSQTRDEFMRLFPSQIKSKIKSNIRELYHKDSNTYILKK